MNICPNCSNMNQLDVVLVDDRVPEMKNGDRIIAPRCRSCGERLIPDNKWRSADSEQIVVLISGLCGAGKSSIGKLLEKKTGYIHIDGDAVSKRVNWDIRNGFFQKRSGYRVFDEMLDTIHVLLQCGYSVIGTYVFTEEALKEYQTKIAELGVKSHIIVLRTEVDVCIQRDQLRDCWTAGEEFVEKWYEEQNALAVNGSWTVLDNSADSLNETVEKILKLTGMA